MATGAVGLVGNCAPGGGIGVRRVAAPAGQRYTMIARVATADTVPERVR